MLNEITNADCFDLLPEIDRASIGAVVTDPPYGYSHKTNSRGYSPWKGRPIAGDESEEARDRVLEWCDSIPCAVFGNWKTSTPAGSRGVLVWDKGLACGLGDLSFPWKMNHEFVYIRGKGWSGHRGGGVLRSEVVCKTSMGRSHPHQKPVGLLRQIIDKAPPGIILDPFCGTGATAVAAKECYRDFIAIEIDPDYCAIARRRIAQGVLAFA